MKPRLVIATTPLPSGGTVELIEHDGRAYFHLHGQQLAGPGTARSEEALVRLACAPFRAVRQPRVLVLGLAFGRVVAAALAALPQQRARFTVAEPLEALIGWHRGGLAGLDPRLLDDPRVEVVVAAPGAALRAGGPWHAILLHADAGPLVHDGRGESPVVDGRWLSAARDAVVGGGLLAIAAARPQPGLRRRLESAGFDVAESFVEAVPQAKRPRQHPLWLARRRPS